MKDRGAQRLGWPVGAVLAAGLAVLLAVLVWPKPAEPDFRVAVASSFLDAAEALMADFEAQTGYSAGLSAGGSGQIYAQIVHGAPFDVFLSADEARPRRLADEGRASGVPQTYALGRLALWSPDPQRVAGDMGALLAGAGWHRIAIANPDLAPYGMAAVQTLDALGVTLPAGRVAMGSNAGQVFAMTASGAADMGMVALALVVSPRNPSPGSRWEVPETYHAPIRQDAVLLRRAEANPAARAFMDYLASDRARAIVTSSGYGWPGDA
ncbi:molybdate ABC transporter substrate-binding protein [Glycocaulis sp.]